MHKVASVPLADNVPLQGVRTGPRAVQWRPTAPATLVWAEALDGGDPRKKVAHRDRLMTLSAPFTSPATELFKIEHRYSGAQWGEKGGLVFVSDYDRDKRWTRTQAIDADNPTAEPRTILSRSINDHYGNPGTPVTRVLASGHRAVLQHGDSIYLGGTGATPEGDRPFLDRMNLQTLKTERLFRCAADELRDVRRAPLATTRARSSRAASAASSRRTTSSAP